MGAKCCAGHEAKDGAADAGAPRPQASQMEEELVKPAAPRRKEWTVTLKKASAESRLGVDIDFSDGVVMIIDKVNEGLVSEWNKLNPDKEVSTGDSVVSVNGHWGSSHDMAEACKRDEVLHLTVERDLD
mmetsp:Transcript_93281/g.273063  ORF Transcript_93281/g.273063 Transcript_93281/m.273063 type:complete len:129 (+) Transcript_93281:67-453(+)